MGGSSAPSTKKVQKQADYQYGLEQKAMQDQLQANRVSQTTPWGSVNWSKDDQGNWSQTTTLDPAEQQRLDQQRSMLTGLGNVASPVIGQVGNALSKGLDLSGVAQGPSGAPTGPQFGTVGTGPQLNTDFGTIDPNQLAKMGQAGPAAQFGGASAAAQQAREYELQKKLNLGDLSAMPEASEAVRQQVIDAQYQQALSRMQPMFEQQRREQLDRLYAMGGREGDPVFEQQKANLERQLTDANQQALWNAIGAGGQEQSRLFGLGMAQRQQGFNEALQSGQFTNEALMNQYQQGLQNAQMGNQVGIANAGFANQAGLANMAAQNQMAQFNAGQGLQGMLAGLGYNREGQTLGNAALQQGFQNQLAGTGFNNQTAQQGFQNQMAQNAEQSRIRNEQIQEQLLQRGLPLQELNSVLNMMGQVQNPQFSSYAQGQLNAPDYLGSWNNAQQMRAQDQAGMMGGLGSLAGVAGSMFGGPIGGALATSVTNGFLGKQAGRG